MRISRQPIDPPYFESLVTQRNSLIDKLIARLSVGSKFIEKISNNAADMFMAASATPGGEKIMREAAEVAVVSGTTVFRFLAGEPSVTVELRGKSIELPFYEPANAHALKYLDTFSFAMVLRDQAALDQLCELDTSMLNASTTETDEYQACWAAVLQAWIQNRPLSDSLAVVRGAAERATIASTRVLSATTSLVDALEAIASRDQRAFDEALARSINAHKEYWTDGDNSFAYDGFVALQALAVACRASDLGMRTTVESEYLPAHIFAWT